MTAKYLLAFTPLIALAGCHSKIQTLAGHYTGTARPQLYIRATTIDVQPEGFVTITFPTGTKRGPKPNPDAQITGLVNPDGTFSGTLTNSHDLQGDAQDKSVRGTIMQTPSGQINVALTFKANMGNSVIGEQQCAIVAETNPPEIPKDQANIARAKADLRLLDQALRNFYYDCGNRYPTNEESLAVLMRAPTGELRPDKELERYGIKPGWKGPYLEKPITIDPWGHPYIYKHQLEHTGVKGYDLLDTFTLRSLGPTGHEGSPGDELISTNGI